MVSPLATVRNSKLKGSVVVGDYSKILDTVILGNVSVGRRSTINGPSEIFALVNTVEIGNFCSFAKHVTIQEYNHPTNRCTTYFIRSNMFEESMENDFVSKGQIVIGSDVWIGKACVVLSGTKIGHGAIIGANSVVTSSIPPYAIAVGSPARVVKYRFDSAIIEQLLYLQWWHWIDERIRQNNALFDGVLTQEKLDHIV